MPAGKHSQCFLFPINIEGLMIVFDGNVCQIRILNSYDCRTT